MARLIWLHDGGRLLLAVRLAFDASPAEFADLLTEQLGWRVPVGVLRAWEKGVGEPPPRVIGAARALADERARVGGRWELAGAGDSEAREPQRG